MNSLRKNDVKDQVEFTLEVINRATVTCYWCIRQFASLCTKDFRNFGRSVWSGSSGKGKRLGKETKQRYLQTLSDLEYVRQKGTVDDLTKNWDNNSSNLKVKWPEIKKECYTSGLEKKENMRENLTEYELRVVKDCEKNI